MSDNNQKEKKIELNLDGNITTSSEGLKVIATRERDIDGTSVEVYLTKEFLKNFDNDEINLEKIFDHNKFTIETIVSDKFHRLSETSSIKMVANDTHGYMI